jgi:hypothetical protein
MDNHSLAMCTSSMGYTTILIKIGFFRLINAMDNLFKTAMGDLFCLAYSVLNNFKNIGIQYYYYSRILDFVFPPWNCV